MRNKIGVISASGVGIRILVPVLYQFSDLRVLQLSFLVLAGREFHKYVPIRLLP
jgi:hypothetical protein